MAASRPTYVYGVRQPSSQSISSAGIGGAELHEIESGGLAALVSDLPTAVEELKLGREELTTHARVLEQALEHGIVLPMRFGVVMENQAAVRARILEAHSEELQAQLQQLDGKVELRVRAMYEERRLMREIVAENSEIARFRDRVRVAPADATYFDRIRMGEVIVAAIEHMRMHDTAQMLERLEPLAEETQIGPSTHERMVMSASFLVARDRLDEFDKAVDQIGRQQADRMRLKYTGPLPPHSFTELATTTSQRV